MKFSKDEMLQILPVILSDLKHHFEAERKEAINKNIQRDIYAYVIRELFSEERFLFKEKESDGSNRVGLFIKGYVREVWDYLQDAYDLIHNTDFEEIIKTHNKKTKKIIIKIKTNKGL